MIPTEIKDAIKQGMKQGFLLYINLSLLKMAVHKTAFSNIFCQLTEMIFKLTQI